MNMRLQPIIGLLLILMSAPSSAIDLIEIYREAQINDAQLQAAKASLDSRSTEIPQARSQLLPQLNAGLSYELVDQASFDSNTLYYQVSLTQPLWDVRRWWNFQASKSAFEESQSTYRNAQLALMQRSAQQYFAVLLADTNYELSLSEETALRRQYEQSQERFNVGLTAKTEMLEAKAAYDQAKANRLARWNDRVLSFIDLEVFIGKPVSSVQRLNEHFPFSTLQSGEVSTEGSENKSAKGLSQEGKSLDFFPPEWRLEHWQAEALKNSLDLKNRQANVRTRELELKEEKATRLPQVNLRATYRDVIDQSDALSGRSLEADDSILMSVDISIPLFSGFGRQAAIRQRAYDVQVSEAEREQVQRRVLQTVNQLYRSIISDQQRLGAQRQSIRSSQSALKATQAGYDVGVRNIVDVLNAQRTLFSNQRDYAQIRFNVVLNILNLKQVSGLLARQDLEMINEKLLHDNPIDIMHDQSSVLP